MSIIYPEFGVSDAIAVLNQSLEYAFPKITVIGEISNFRVSKSRWLYFDLVDEYSSLKFWGSVNQLPSMLENGMSVKVQASPKIHPKYGFSMQIGLIELFGEGTIKKAADLLMTKLMAEGLFDTERKRPIKYPPSRIGLITSSESAAYADFTKVLNARFGGIEITVVDVLVQGSLAVSQICQALDLLNSSPDKPDVIVITRGGGSLEDLAVFNDESLTRAVANSASATMVAVGHEIDVSLAELAADKRASTPSNAAELLVPDRVSSKVELVEKLKRMNNQLFSMFDNEVRALKTIKNNITSVIEQNIIFEQVFLNNKSEILESINPVNVLKRGFVAVKHGGDFVKKGLSLSKGQSISLEFFDSIVESEVTGVSKK